MAQRKTDKTVTEIRKLLKENKLIIGTKRTLNGLKLGKVSKVFVSSNCPADVLAKIKHYSKLSKTEVIRLSYPNEEVGTLCKKSFSISVFSVIK